MKLSQQIKCYYPNLDSGKKLSNFCKDSFRQIGIIEKLIMSITCKDFISIENLLDENGSYDIQNDSFETIAVGKIDYLNWLCPLLNCNEIASIERDICFNCKIGNPVLIINGGSFPRQIQSSAEPFITGLMLEFTSDKIVGISFCYSFVEKQNCSVFNNNINKIKQLELSGLTTSQASLQVLGYDFTKCDF